MTKMTKVSDYIKMFSRLTDEDLIENQCYNFTKQTTSFMSYNDVLSKQVSYTCYTMNGRYIGDYTEESLHFYFKTLQEVRDDKLNSLGI